VRPLVHHPRRALTVPFIFLPHQRSDRIVGRLFSNLRRKGDQAVRILVVEDDEGVLAYIKGLLLHDGHTVETAENGDEALRHYRKHGPYDLVLTDRDHPGLTGEELSERIRQVDAKQVIGFLTGYADKVAYPVLLKPFQAEDLFNFVRDVVSGMSVNANP
jgi:two-component system cell cycle response regulator CpdR